MTANAEITCKELVELLGDYLDDAIVGPDRDRLEAHLAGCTGCTSALEQLRTTSRIAGTLTEEQVPAAQRDALLEAFRAWRQDAEA
jgi:anti-sigma factor RsiW